MTTNAIRTSALQLAKERGDGVGTELRGVEGCRRKAGEGFGNLLGRDAARLGGRFPDEEIGQDGTGCDRRDAALRLEPGGGYAPVFEANGEAQHVAADRVRDLDGGAGVEEVAGIVRITKVVENRIAKHGRQYKAEKEFIALKIHETFRLLFESD